MFQRIVVPLDGSGFGEAAVPWALSVARRSGGRLHLVTVVTPLPHVADGENDNGWEGGRLLLAQQHAEIYLEGVREWARESEPEVPVDSQVELGPVVESLVRFVEDLSGDLVVMSSHGRGPLHRAWLGSITDGLLRRAPAPILVVRPGGGTALEGSTRPREKRPASTGAHGGGVSEAPSAKHLLVTLDGSPQSAEILPYAVGLARLFGARMTLVRVIPPRVLLGPAYFPHLGGGPCDQEGEERTIRGYLEAQARPLRESGLDVAVEVVLGVHPAEGILWCGEDLKADLIALATHGRGGVKRLLLGSVADKLVRGSSAPVLLHRQAMPPTSSPPGTEGGSPRGRPGP